MYSNIKLATVKAINLVYYSNGQYAKPLVCPHSNCRNLVVIRQCTPSKDRYRACW